jgi:molecular chaperone GrpE
MAGKKKKNNKKKKQSEEITEDTATKGSPSVGAKHSSKPSPSAPPPPPPKSIDEMSPEELEDIMQKLGAVEHETLEHDRAEAEKDASDKDSEDTPKAKDKADYEDEYLRKRAELDNFKKRIEREKADYLDYANVELIKLILPSIDNLERALTHSGEDSEIETLKQGIELTLKDLQGALKKFGLNHIKAEGTRFDPTLHEAISQVESTEHDDGTVTKELQKGYQLKDRLIRPALVVVSQKPSEASEDNTAESDTKKGNGEDTDTCH